MAPKQDVPAIYSIVTALRPGDPGPKSIVERPPRASVAGCLIARS